MCRKQQTNIIIRAVCNEQLPRAALRFSPASHKNHHYIIYILFLTVTAVRQAENFLYERIKNAVFTRFRHAANTRRDIPHTPDCKLISKYPKNTPHRNPQTTPQGIPQSTPQAQNCKSPSFFLQNAFILLEFSLESNFHFWILSPLMEQISPCSFCP